jgi:hypothetical protein
LAALRDIGGALASGQTCACPRSTRRGRWWVQGRVQQGAPIATGRSILDTRCQHLIFRAS